MNRRGFLGTGIGAVAAGPSIVREAAEKVSRLGQTRIPTPVRGDLAGDAMQASEYIPKMDHFASFRHVDKLREIVKTGKVPMELLRHLPSPSNNEPEEPWRSMRVAHHTKWRMQDTYYLRKQEREFLIMARKQLARVERVISGQWQLSDFVQRNTWIDDILHRFDYNRNEDDE